MRKPTRKATCLSEAKKGALICMFGGIVSAIALAALEGWGNAKVLSILDVSALHYFLQILPVYVAFGAGSGAIGGFVVGAVGGAWRRRKPSSCDAGENPANSTDTSAPP